MKRNLLSLVILLCFSVKIYCINEDAGTTGLQFLKIGPEARGASLSGAVIADVSGVEALYWNPAGLNGIDGKEIMLSYNKWWGDNIFINSSFGMPLLLSLFGKIGIGITYFGSGELPKTPGVLQTEYYSIVGNIGYGFKISKFLLGAVLKYAYTDVFGISTHSPFLDIGTIFEVVKNLKVGLVLKNAGFIISKDLANDTIPFVYEIGLGYNYSLNKKNSFNVFVASGGALDENLSFKIGSEYDYNETVFLRAGYTLNNEDNLSFTKGLNLGTGVKLGDLRVELGWLFYGELGNVLQTSVKYSF